MRYISLFSGIECASLAARPLGWTPICFAEIEQFPSAVLAHHYPDVPNVGDMTAHDWSQYRGRCDVVIGGSPCQAFSVAGRRESLSDVRGNLTLAFVEAVNAIDPAIVVWENVPGVLSTADNAFGCFLAALAGSDSPLIPPRGRKWTNAGMADGPRRSIAWRILDAQFYGVPQRRRRVFLIARRAGERPHPAKILFEFGGMRRDSAPRGEAGEEAADAVGTCAEGRGGASHWDGGAHPPLSQSHNTGGIGMSDQELFSQGGAGLVPVDVVGAVSSKWAKGTGGPAGDECQNLIPVVSGTLGGGSGNRGWSNCLDVCGALIPEVVGAIAADSFTGGAGGRPEGAAAGHFLPVVTGTLTGSRFGADEGDAARGMYIPVIVPPVTQRPYADNASREGLLVAHTLRGEGFDASEDGSGRGTPLIPTYAIKTSHTQSNGWGVSEGAAYTLDNSGGCGQVIAFHGSQDPDVSGDVSHTVGRNQGQETCIAFTQNQAGDVLTGDVAPALGTNANATGRNTAKILYFGVRRLTPRECERLQGLPDDYTLIPWRGKPATDGNRYKAIGNGMAVPCVRWILERIHNAMN